MKIYILYNYSFQEFVQIQENLVIKPRIQLECEHTDNSKEFRSPSNAGIVVSHFHHKLQIQKYLKNSFLQ